MRLPLPSRFSFGKLLADPRALLALGALFFVAAPLTRCVPPVRVEERAVKVFDERAQLDATTATTAARARHVETRTERRPDGTVTRVRVEDEREIGRASW